MEPLESSKVKKKKRPLILLAIFLAIIVGLLFAAIHWGPALYYQFSGDAIVRLDRRTQAYEKRYLEGHNSRAELYSLLESTRKMADLLEKNDPASARLQYYLGLLDFYEFVLRIPLTPSTLLDLTGKGYLPLDSSMGDLPRRSVPDLSLRFTSLMRRALALDPELAEASTAHLIIAYGDLFYTGRTDLNLLRELEQVHPEKLTRYFLAENTWIRLAIYTILARKQELTTMMETLHKTDPNHPEALEMSDLELNLILAQGSYYSHDYLQALMLARQIKYNPQAPLNLRVDAATLEAELFLVQSGIPAAMYYYQEALQISGGKDSYIESRLEALKSGKQ